MALIRFKHSFNVCKLLLNPQTTYDFECPEVGLHVRLTNDPPPEDDGKSKVAAVLDLCRTIEVTEKRAFLLRELEQRILESIPSEESLPSYPADAPAVSKVIKFEDMPGPLQALSHEVKRDWVPFARQIIHLLRWRYGKWSELGLLLRKSTRWENCDSGNWFRIPSYLPAPDGLGRIESGMSHHDLLDGLLQRSIDGRRSEPIGHSLLQSAFSISNGRAAIVLAVSAVEVALKALVSEKIPQAEWLAFNLPMPPVEKIIREYVPLLFPEVNRNEYTAEIFPKDVMEAVAKFVGIRNAIAHRGEDADSRDSWKCCDCMRDVLFRLDYLNGHKWAKYYWRSPAVYGTNEQLKMNPEDSVVLRYDPTK